MPCLRDSFAWIWAPLFTLLLFGSVQTGVRAAPLGDAAALTRLEKAVIAEDARGDEDRAVADLNRALVIARRLRNVRKEAAIFDALGNVAVRQARFLDALAAFTKADGILRRTKDVRGEAKVFRDFGLAAMPLGRYESALVAYVQATNIDQQLKDQAHLARDLNALSNVAMRLGQPALALNLRQRALAIDHERKNLSGEAADLDGIGGADVLMARFDAGLTAEQQALDIHRRLKNHRGEANDLNNIGSGQFGLGHLDAAATALQASLAIHRQLKDHLGEVQNLVNLAVLANRQRDFAQAISDCRAAATLADAISVPEPSWRALNTCADAESHSNLRDAALADYEATLTRIESLRNDLSQSDRSNFITAKLYVYDNYIAYLRNLDAANPGQGYDRKALEVLERKESRALLDQIGGSEAQRFNGVPPSVLIDDRGSIAALKAAQAALTASTDVTRAAARTRFETALANRSTFEQRMQRAYPAYYALLHPVPQTVDAMQQHVLRDDEVLLSYDTLAGKSVLFVLTRDRLMMVSLPGSDVLSDAVARLRTHIGLLLGDVVGGILPASAIAAAATDDIPGFAADSNALYRQLIPPALDDMLAGKKLIIVPSGPLYDVPWEALVTRMQGANPRYLLEDHPISYTPSGSLLAVVRAAAGTHPGRAPLLAFANPAYGDAQTGTARGAMDELRYNALRDDDGGGFPELPGSAVEADAVREALHASAESVVTGEDATRDHLLALNKTHQLENYRYILFATHAVLPNSVRGIDQPALVLAHPAQGGFVTMADVFDLSLDADFVALSACNTGLGARLAGEGISGLTRSFLYAGTPAISVTLWEVDDAAAPQITPAFFAGMQSGLSAAEALRQAKLALIHAPDARLRHPYAWAPTVIFGDGTSAPLLP